MFREKTEGVKERVEPNSIIKINDKLQEDRFLFNYKN